MTKDMMLEEEALKLVNGGVLQEGWEDTLVNMMALYKGKFGDNEIGRASCRERV